MKKFFLIAAISISYALPALAADTADFYKCTGKVGGEWNFGRAPNGCDAASFGEDSALKHDYEAVVFDDGETRTTERKRYMQEMYAVIRDGSSYYFKKRKPNASAEELAAFQFMVLTVANQESYWSQYRMASDNKMKMMRGDSGHGHGMMQVDDRSHFDSINAGTGWSLAKNMAYGMDILFTNWEKAATTSCVGSSSNWENRTRAAWAAYNGGGAKLCRWTNSKDTWAQNDINFYNTYKNKAWAAFVTNFDQASNVNIACLIEGGENCLNPGEIANQLNLNQLYTTSAGKACVVTKAGALSCVAETRDALCLRSVSSFTSETAKVITDDVLAAYKVTNLDRHAACAAFDPTVIGVGKMLVTNNAIVIRSTPAGGYLAVALEGEVAEVLDFEIRNLDSLDRYYKISVDGQTGWIYGGTSATQAKWVAASSLTSALPTVVARVGEQVQVVNGGINMREKPDGDTVLTLLPTGTKVTVEGYVIQGSSNYLYYQVTYNKKTGFIYSGALLPKDTTTTWTKRIK
jgi:hypothetical protein